MTFSIVARCQKTLTLGVVVATAAPAVGSVVPHAEANVGAIATQANTNILYGVNGLKLLKRGFSPKSALDVMLKKDTDRETRQIIMIDKNGYTAAFTGKQTIPWKGHIIGKNYVIAGNMLVGKQVIETMAQAFEHARGELADRLLAALEAGQNEGGDKRGKTSAALLVVGKGLVGPRPFISLRVDVHKEPVKELKRVFVEYQKYK
ncbi:MAG: DUF1028 domain-containing protein [Candidatus Bathyarchaeia archaeon]|jgi:uncharacterized Ntn-hydrolase superfamily protein|nr:DUF1028 domain-containing protein [Candidatus Bathyarchaeota archaeon A05DMB-4]MDH7595510.1 DUF1028 domain-containing protein [Candidatus Bathyarchaeota archaeon]